MGWGREKDESKLASSGQLLRPEDGPEGMLFVILSTSTYV